MISLMVIFVITVKVDIVAVVALGITYSIVARLISTIRVSQWENVNIDIVQQVKNAAVRAGTQLVDKTQHENHTSNLITVHSGSVEELRFALGTAVVDAHT